MLSPRAIATLGVGYGARISARLGLWPVAERPSVIPLREDGGALVAARAARRRREDDALLVMVLL